MIIDQGLLLVNMSHVDDLATESVVDECNVITDSVNQCYRTLNFVAVCVHILTYLAESPPDQREKEARVWALELHSSFCYSFLLCPSVVQQTA